MIKLSIIFVLVCYEMFAQSFKMNDIAYLDQQGGNPFTAANGYFPLGTSGGGLPFDISCTITGAWQYGFFTTNGGTTNILVPTYGSSSTSSGSYVSNGIIVSWGASGGQNGSGVYGGLMVQFPFINCSATTNGITVSGAGEAIYIGHYLTNSTLSDTYGIPVFEKIGSSGAILIASNIFGVANSVWIIVSNAAPVSLSFARTIYAITNAPVIPAYGATFNSTTNGLNGLAALPTPTATFYITNHP